MIDPSKKYKTRDGKPVIHLHRAPEGWPTSFPWRGIVGENHDVTWNDDGRVFINDKSHSDLIEDREPLEFTQIVDAKGTRFNNESNLTLAEWDWKYPRDAPHRIATFIEKIQTPETP
jgi:hypothetical protein